MKRHIKKIITIVLCVSMMQPALHAAPFGEFCRKWVARAAAVGYWGILGNHALGVCQTYSNTIELRDNINSQSIINGTSLFPNLSDYAPVKAAQIDALLQKEGISKLDRYNVKVLTNQGIGKFAFEASLKLGMSRLPVDARKALGRDLQLQIETLANLQEHGSPAHIGDTTIVIPEASLHYLDTQTLAASLAHEEEHSIQKHVEKRAAITAAAPFAIHAGCKGIYSALFGAPKNTPTITRSLLRIPRAGAVLGASYLAQKMYSRDCERQADKAVQESPLLSRSLAHLMKRIDDKGHLEAALAKNWQIINRGGESITDMNRALDKALATNMTKEQYVSFMCSAISMINTHPWTSERAGYLEQWAKEAQAKKEQNK